MRKTPMKNEPDFSNLDDARVKSYKAMITDLIGVYSELPEKQEVLKSVWKDLSNECADRITDEPKTANLARSKGIFLKSLKRK